ncbi:MAG: hypothetical protein Crog4KO_00560 [Crocinitomicaceae bacterium]
MKELFQAGIISIFFWTPLAYCQGNADEPEWIRYNLESLALFADLPTHLESACGESFCNFSSADGSPFESLTITRLYQEYEHDFHYYPDSSSNHEYRELLTDSTVIYIAHMIITEKEGLYRSSALFRTANYEFQLQYVGPNSKLFTKFIKSIEIDHEKLKEQYERNKIELDYSNLELEFEIDLGEKNFVLNRAKNPCKIRMPQSDSIHLFLSCSGCVLRNIKDDEWMIIPSPKGDEIKISLQTSLPENRTHTFYEKIIPVRKEE